MEGGVAFRALRAAIDRKYWGSIEPHWSRWEKSMLAAGYRHPAAYFSRPTVERIAQWKNRDPLRGTVESQIRQNTPSRVVQVTRLAFAAKSAREALEILSRTEKLVGVGYPVASAILTFHNPRKFTVLDKNAWRALYLLGYVSRSEPPKWSGETYSSYLESCRRVSTDWRLGLRDTDRILWQLGKR